MNIWEAVGLGVLQGLTEFVPVSSSGHLILAEEFLGLEVSEMLSFDVLLHAGTLVALVVLFWDKWLSILRGDWRLFLMLSLATVPAVVAVLLGFEDFLGTIRSGYFVAIAFLLSGTYLLLTRYAKVKKNLAPNFLTALVTGLSQVVAMTPGISRSGTTTATGEFLGLSRKDASEFAFMMLLPITLGAVSYTLMKGEFDAISLELGAVGFFSSALVSFFSAKYMLKFLRKFGLSYFGVYLVVMGAGMLVYFFTK